MTFLKISGLLLLLLVATNLWWRWLSRRRLMPCPTLFAGILENAWMGRLIGTQTTLDRLNLQPGQRVLEIGPGPGRLLLPAAQRVLPDGEVIGLDIQPGMIERLKSRADCEGITNLIAIVGNATRPHLLPESIDMVYLCTVLGEIPDRTAALHQCYTALKHDGVLSITEIFPDPHFQPRAAVKQLATMAGFRIQEECGRWFFFTINFVKV